MAKEIGVVTKLVDLGVSRAQIHQQYRAIATRYDKGEQIYQGTLDVASIRIWLRDRVP